MDEQQPRFHRYFHNFLIYFAMWMFAAFAFLYGGKYIYYSEDYSAPGRTVFVVLGILLILVGAFVIKARFDLAAFRPSAPKELLIACVAAAAVVLGNQVVKYFIGEDSSSESVFAGLILICWGIAVYKYYNDRKYMFRN